MRINGPTTRAVTPSSIVLKRAPSIAFAQWNSGFTDFPGPSSTGPRTGAVVASQPPVSEQIIASLAQELAQEHTQLPL
jgi:hypothetical protein